MKVEKSKPLTLSSTPTPNTLPQAIVFIMPSPMIHIYSAPSLPLGVYSQVCVYSEALFTSSPVTLPFPEFPV